jgi:hypothetical protein
MKFCIKSSYILKSKAFWDIAPCSLLGVDRRFGGAYCLHHEDDDEVRTSETSVNYNVPTRRYIPEDSKLHVFFG